MTLFIADIASYQQNLNLSSLHPDCVGVRIKCTQGTSYVDPDYTTWFNERQRLTIFEAYHYCTTDSPTAQANWIAKNILDPRVPLMFDIEQGSGNFQNDINVIDACLQKGLNAKDAYLPKSFWQSIGSPDLTPLIKRGISLTNASYPRSNSGSPTQLYPGDSYSGWDSYGNAPVTYLQFTDSAVEGGQTVDMNAYKGSLQQLKSLLNFSISPSSYPVSTPGREDMSTTSVNGRAGLAWPAGQCHVFEVNYSAAGQIDLVLNAELKLTTGPVYLPSPLVVPHTTGTESFQIPTEYVPNCRGVILTVKSGPTTVTYDVCAV